MIKIRKQEALDYHSQGRPGKIEVVPTKPYSSQRDLSLAYSPGVAEPCLEIAKNKEDVYKYTAKQNLVAVISNGTAVLGLGDIGPEASKPVMEGKGLLFKIFADIDVFDIEVDAKNVDDFIDTVKRIAPTFGGINLEDIKAPEAFEIEERLKAELDIPVMHDDQHGTAIISSAALINALELADKKIEDVKVVVSGAGAAAISCAKLYVSLGVKKSNIFMFDSKGLINADRTNLDVQKQGFVNPSKDMTLEESLVGADVFLGLSKGGIVSKKMVKSMANNAIIFALANPDPEISYKEAKAAREDIIMATGRSDNPNQVNNVLGFPYIFRGALDVRATTINEEMKLAAVHAIADLAKEVVPEEVNEAYGEKKSFVFGPETIIPKPLDPRLITSVAPAVAKAAMDSGVAKAPITDWNKYNLELDKKLGRDEKVIRTITDKVKKKPQRVVFAEGDNYKILKAAQIAKDEGLVEPILLGRKKQIHQLMETYAIDMEGVTIIDPKDEEIRSKREFYGKELFIQRERKGLTEYEAVKLMRERNYFGAMMLQVGDADAMVSGLTRNYKDVLIPGITILGKDDESDIVAGMYLLLTKQGPLFFADTTVNINPTADQLVKITTMVDKAVRSLNITPNIAMVSYSNFGSGKGEDSTKVSEAVSVLHKNYPKINVDGEIQANFAFDNDLLKEKFPFSKLVDKKVNVLIFPNLSAGNVSYKLLQEKSDFESVGPILLGLKKSYHVLQMGASVREIVNVVKIAALNAQSLKNRKQ